MFVSTCPICRGSMFEVIRKDGLLGSNVPLAFVQCAAANCKTVVGVIHQDSLDAGRLNMISERLDGIESALRTLGSNIAEIERQLRAIRGGASG